MIIQVTKNALNSTVGRLLILDSGVSYHLVDASSLTEEEDANKWKLDEPIGMNSANGVIWAEWCTMIYVPQLGMKVKALILKDSQNVLSLGKIIREEGFDYW